MVPGLHNPDSLDSLLKLDSISAEKCFDRMISIRKKELYPKTISDYESEIEQLRSNLDMANKRVSQLQDGRLLNDPKIQNQQFMNKTEL